MAALGLLSRIVVALAITAGLIVLIPGIPPDIQLEAFEIRQPAKVEGWFVTNTILDQAEVYYESPHGGTESVAVLDDNTIITGDASGTLLKITGKQAAEPIARLMYPCSVDKPTVGPLCGWPLGMRLDPDGNLMTMDYFGGLTRVDLKTGSGAYENIIPKSRPIDGKIGHVPEDFDIGKDGAIYWTDGSTIGNFFEEMVSQPSGRLMKYDPVKRTSTVLLDKLWFSNGVCLSEDDEFVLVVDTGRCSIQRYYLKGEKKGQTDTFADGFPGYPDNLRSNGRGGYYVALAAPWNDQFSMKLDLISGRPLLRKLILRSRYLFLKMLASMKRFYPDNTYLNILEKYVLENEPILGLSSMPKTATIVELSGSGEIIGILNGKSGRVSGVSQIAMGTNYAFITSPFEGKVWRIPTKTLRQMH